VADLARLHVGVAEVEVEAGVVGPFVDDLVEEPRRFAERLAGFARLRALEFDAAVVGLLGPLEVADAGDPRCARRRREP
jgi:hypothetical protein